MTLQEASQRFPFKVSTLRNQINVGNLAASKVGRRLLITEHAIEEMIEKCRVAPKVRVSTSTENEGNGLSEMDQITGARAALQETLRELKKRSDATLGRNTGRRRANSR